MTTQLEDRLGHALQDLAADRPFALDLDAIERRGRRARMKTALTRSGVTLTVAAVAAAAVGLGSSGQSVPTPKSPRRSAPLTRLADYVLAGATHPAGDATKVIRTTTLTGRRPLSAPISMPTTASTSTPTTRPNCPPESRLTRTSPTESLVVTSPSRSSPRPAGTSSRLRSGWPVPRLILERRTTSSLGRLRRPSRLDSPARRRSSTSSALRIEQDCGGRLQQHLVEFPRRAYRRGWSAGCAGRRRQNSVVAADRHGQLHHDRWQADPHRLEF